MGGAQLAAAGLEELAEALRLGSRVMTVSLVPDFCAAGGDVLTDTLPLVGPSRDGSAAWACTPKATETTSELPCQ
ncbi:hypothetical protein, partial [Frankia sp. Cr1]|uniref:hypothetical protein n=1 Tax=Frankia sp. Cr1 TaxID=3073931 RepID=UPI002AD56C9B